MGYCLSCFSPRTDETLTVLDTHSCVVIESKHLSEHMDAHRCASHSLGYLKSSFCFPYISEPGSGLEATVKWRFALAKEPLP